MNDELSYLPLWINCPSIDQEASAKDREDDRIYKDGFAFLVPPLEKGERGI